MTNLRTTVVMKTDLRDSTPLFRGLAEAGLSELLAGQKRLVSQLVARNGGQIVKGEGDAFWVTFPSVTAAAQTAIQIQQELRGQQAGKLGEDRVAVRIVISVGDVLHQNADVFGYPVNLTARIEAITPPDEIYLSQAAWLALNQAEIETEFVDEFQFKGVAAPERVYRVAQAHRTRKVRDQVIVSGDLRHFSAFMRACSLGQIEALLLELEKMLKSVCAEHGGVIRSGMGDSFFLSFADPRQALTAVGALSRQWDAFAAGQPVYCPLALGLQRGDLLIFRSFLFGDDLGAASEVQAALRLLYPNPARSYALVSQRVYEAVVGLDWPGALRRVLPQASMNPRLEQYLQEYAIYELVAGD